MNTRPRVLSVAAVLLTGAPAIAECFGVGHTFEFLFLAWTGLTALAVVAIGADRRWSRGLLIGAVSVLLGGSSFVLTRKARTFAFARLADRSTRVVSAIEAYSKHHGGPPPTLQSLVPAYLDRVPQTGMPACSEYAYEAASPRPAASELAPPKAPNLELARHGWELSVPCSMGFANGDTFFYWSDHDYPTDTGAGNIERIQDWAYLHE